MLNALDLSELSSTFTPCEFRVKWADSGWEIEQARRLRRAVFCVEQGIFVGDDSDAIDDHAQLLVAVSQVGGMPDQVVGTVRIHAAAVGDGNGGDGIQAAPVFAGPRGDNSAHTGATAADRAAPPCVWWGSRLAVHAAFRQHGRLGATLIRLAVSSAHARGCDIFLAHVQQANVPLFEKLHWTAWGEQLLHGRRHALMRADLAHYPPCHDPRRGYAALRA